MYSVNVRVAPQGMSSNSLEGLNGAQRASVLELDARTPLQPTDMQQINLYGFREAIGMFAVLFIVS